MNSSSMRLSKYAAIFSAEGREALLPVSICATCHRLCSTAEAMSGIETFALALAGVYFLSFGS